MRTLLSAEGGQTDRPPPEGDTPREGPLGNCEVFTDMWAEAVREAVRALRICVRSVGEVWEGEC